MPRSLRRTIRAALAISAAVLSSSALAVTFTAPQALAADSATINGSTTFQTIDGFGFAEAFGEAASVMNAPSAEQQQALNLLMSPTAGAGLDIVRNEISADSGTTIEPNSPGSPGAAPAYVSLASINSDQGQLWFDQQAKTNFGVNTFFADAWSAPAFMKTNGSQDNGGQVCGVSGATCSSGDWRQAFANYLIQYAKDYAAAGVPLTYIGPTNEPDFSASYDSMTMSGAQLASLLDVVGPAVKSSGLSTQIECCDATGWPNTGSYASAVEADPTALADTAVFSSHGYSGAPTTPLAGWTKHVWQTEWFGNDSSSWDPAWDDGTADSGLTWAQHIYQGLTGANLSAFLFWQGADPNNGNGGLVFLQSGGTAAASGRLWAFANYSRYIHPGAVRIGSTSSNSGVDISAYKNTDGTVAVVALNTLSSSDTINYTTSGIGGASGTVTPWLTNASSTVAAQPAIGLSSGAFSATVPGRSLVTYVIKPSGTVDNTVTVVNPAPQSTIIGNPVSLQISASDATAGQTLSYSATGLPAGLSINSSTGLISGTPTTDGSSTVMVTATDGAGATGTATFTWSVTAPQQNIVTVTNPGTQTSTVGTATSVQIHATDSGSGQTLTYSATGMPAGLAINSSTGLISGTPTTSGTSSVTVTAKDGTGSSGSATFTWTVATGTPPSLTVTNPGPQSGTVGTAVTPLQIQATATPAGQTLTYSATGLPAGLSISPSTGVISGTPTVAGSYTVTVTVMDSMGATFSVMFTWTVSTTTGGGGCHVVYTRNSEWPGGFTAQVVITNRGTTAMTSWSLTFTYPGDEKVTSNFNGGFSQTGENVTLTNASYNGSIAPGGSVTDGFQGSWTSNDALPTSFSVNGTACT